MIGITRYSSAEAEKLLGSYLEFQPDGLLITGLDHPPEGWRRLEAFGRPVVHMMELAEQPGACSVGLSQEAAGTALAEHLLARGYRRIGFVAAQLDPRTLARGAGYRAALQAAGLHDPTRELRVLDASSISLGAELLDRMLEQAPDCDALFFCNDDLAQGALFRCHRRGIAVPSSLAIAGFNDLPVSAWCTPSLTTIATPRYAIGRTAATMLLELLDGKEPAERRVDLGFELKVRESS
ncbi:MAG: substrate-binding domain-containing protein [Aliidongia sp.]